MNMTLLSIGKMASLNRLSVSTLRLYDEKGLLKPKYIDPKTGYRYYSIDQNARLDVIIYMKELGMSLDEAGFTQIHSYNIGTSILYENFEEDRFEPERIFILTNRKEEVPGFQVAESGMYACVYLDNFDDEIQYARKLREYCIQNGYHMAGDYFCEVMTGFQVFDGDPRSMFMRLQVTVRFRK